MAMVVLESLYLALLVLLSLYGMHSLILTWLYLRHRHETTPDPTPPVAWPG